MASGSSPPWLNHGVHDQDSVHLAIGLSLGGSRREFRAALRDSRYDVTLMARWKPGQSTEEECQGIRVLRVGRGLPSQTP